jgi:predicted RNA-binding Zn ribbon-like protein
LDVLAIEFIDRSADGDLATAETSARWLAACGIRSELDGPACAALRGLRERVDHLLRAAAAGVPPSTEAIDHVNACSAAASVAPQLNWPAGGQPRMWLSTPAGSQAMVLGLIARSAIDLLAGADRSRLRICQAHGCDRVYLTASARRRWCSAACGNRVRVARHAARRRAR